MRAIATVFSLILALLLTACHESQVTAIDSNGQPVNLSQHPNRWLLINYWAPWCSHCRDEIGELNQFYRNHRQQILLYGVDFDRLPLAKLRQESQRLGIEYPLLPQDPAEALKLGPITTVPVTYVFDPNGRLHTVLQGPQTQTSLATAIGE